MRLTSIVEAVISAPGVVVAEDGAVPSPGAEFASRDMSMWV